MSRNSPALWALLASAALLLAGCNGGGTNGSNGSIRRTDPQRPAFLVYEATGRKTLVDALGNRKVVKLSQKVYASAAALRLVDRLSGTTDIMRLDRKVVWRLDREKRTYRRVTFGEYAAQVEGIKALLAHQLSDRKMSPAQRRSIQIAIGRIQPKVTVKVDPETVEILGRKCRHVSYYEDERLRIEEWVAEGLDLPCDLNEVRALSGDFSRELLKKLKGRRGFALKIRVLGRMPTRPRVEEREVTSVELPEKLDPNLFELPVGYTRDTGAPRRPRG
jgi:hypothetical protein